MSNCKSFQEIKKQTIYEMGKYNNYKNNKAFRVSNRYWILSNTCYKRIMRRFMELRENTYYIRYQFGSWSWNTNTLDWVADHVSEKIKYISNNIILPISSHKYRR